jgi:hypothetical protein
MTVSELFAKLTLSTDEASFRKGEAAIAGLGGLLAGIGLTVAAVRAGMEALIKSTADEISATNKAAQRAGVARDAFAELAHAAEENGLAAEGFETALKFLNRSAYEAAHGSTEAASAYHRLGISVKDGSGHLKTADALFEEVVERWKTLPDGPEKTALAMKLFGRAGTELIPMLNRGGESLAEFRREAHELGKVFSDEDVAAAKAYKKSLHDMGEEVEAVKRAIGKELLREAGGAAHAMAEWLKANRGWIVEKIHDAIALASSAWKKAKGVLEPFVALVKFLVSQTWLLKAGALALAVVLLAHVGNSLREATFAGLKYLATLGSITAAQVAGAAAAMATGLAWVAGIGLALAAIEELYGWITGDRDTLIEEWLGPFDQFGGKLTRWIDDLLKINPGDSAFMVGLKSVLQVIFDIQGAVEKLQKWINSDSDLAAAISGAMATVNFVGYGALAPFSDSARATRDESWSRMGYDAGRLFLDDRGRQASGWNDRFAPIRGSPGGGVNLTIPVTVQAPPDTASPVDWGRVIGEQVNVVVDGKLRGIFDGAHEAVAR